MQGLGHQGVAAALDDVGTAFQQLEEALFALLHEDDVAFAAFRPVIAKDVAGPVRGLQQKVHQLAVRGIALVDHHMAVVTGIETQHALAQDGRHHAGMVAGLHRRRIEGDQQILFRGPEQIAGRDALQQVIPPHARRQPAMATAGDDVLMIEGQAVQTGLFGRTRHEVFQVRHADVGLELVDKAQHLIHITPAVPEQRDGLAHRGAHIHLIVTEHRAQIGDAVHPEFGFQYLGGVVIGHEQKFVCAQTAGDGQPAHGMAMPCPGFAPFFPPVV